jgi:DNA-binding response OmpR family regulator
MMKEGLILVIEDEDIIASLMKDNLEQWGYEVMVASSGTEGLRRAEYLKPDIITLDIMMPGLDGLQVLQKLKQNKVTRRIPVLLLSVAGDAKCEGLRLGAVDFFKKPLDFKRLNKRIKELTQRETVLVIENEENILKLIETRLSSLGFKTIGALDGSSAILKAKESLPDLILIDYLLPKRDGFEVIGELKKDNLTSDIPVIVFSGYMQENLDKEILGIDKFLGKRFSVDELAREVVDTLKKRNMERNEE